MPLRSCGNQGPQQKTSNELQCCFVLFGFGCSISHSPLVFIALTCSTILAQTFFPPHSKTAHPFSGRHLTFSVGSVNVLPLPRRGDLRLLRPLQARAPGTETDSNSFIEKSPQVSGRSRQSFGHQRSLLGSNVRKVDGLAVISIVYIKSLILKLL
ncbi:hypothetical protein PoB_000362400 [Plakobranchus ocellatus]|uniref:Uncharacterized protein n=1 Tax=Plakobranchus ocellatus TaxID=259542 RepID=A0AAV3Y4F4_9GAST|nr:hypothetical protein PoB_000362400 [Plakobranchus ocellatus]